MNLSNPTEEDFNSSDYLDGEGDWDRRQFKLNDNAGKRQAQDIIDNQVEDRRASKRNSRKLEYSIGAPKSQETSARVSRTWDAFCQALSHE
jgi:hypothetical protein